jgi:hypothetical protein
MPDVDDLIARELTLLVDRAPMAPSVRDITFREASPTATRRRRPALGLVAAAAAVIVLAGGTAVVVAGRDGADDGPGQVRAAPSGPGFVDTVAWPHYLMTTPPAGVELQLVQEIRPGGLPSWTTQSFRVGDAGGSILLAVQALPGDSGDGPLDSTDEVLGHPIAWLDDQDAPTQASWSWPGAQVIVNTDGLTRSDAEDALGSLVAREGGPIAGFNGPSDGTMVITDEHFAADGQPAIARAWYGTAERIDYEVQAVAPVADLQPSLDLVSLGGDGSSERRVVAGRDVLVARFHDWLTVAWFDTDGTLVSVHARNAPDDALESIVAGIGRVDQATWDEGVARASALIAERDTVDFADVGGARLSARGPNGAPDLCVELDGATPVCAANLGRRDGGPYVMGPAGLLAWTMVEGDSAIASFVVDGSWWVAGRVERSYDPVVDTAGGPVAVDVVEKDGATWFLAAMPSDADRYVLRYGGSVRSGWRPSSAQ